MNTTFGKTIGAIIIPCLWLATTAPGAVWNVDADGNWNSSGNWNPPTPPVTAGSIADLSGPGGITADRTITLDVNASVGSLLMSDANGVANSWFIVQGGANTLTLTNTSGNPFITVNQGTANQINVPLAVANSAFNVTVASGARLIIGGNVSGNKVMNLYGAGVLELNGNNAFSQIRYTNSSVVAFNNANAFGTATIFPDWTGITLTLSNASSGPLTISPSFTPVFGLNARFAGADITNSGNLLLTAAQGMTLRAQTGQTVTFTGNFTGSGALTFWSGGTFVLDNNASTRASNSVITIGFDNSAQRIVVANDQALGNTNTTVTLMHNQTLSAAGGTRTINSKLRIYGYQGNGATWYDYFEGSNPLIFTGNVELFGANNTRLVMNDAATEVVFNGNWTATYNGGTLFKAGPGTMVLNGGTSSLTNWAVTVMAGTLKGTGTLAGVTTTIQSGATIAAGNSVGVLHLGNLVMQNNSTNEVELSGGGGVAGVDFDQLDVTGTVNLGSNAVLKLQLGYTPAPGDSWTILNNDGTDAITGLFKSVTGQTLTQGLEFGFNPGGTLGYKISYTGGTGNDIVLWAVPEPSVLLLVVISGLLAWRKRRIAGA